EDVLLPRFEKLNDGRNDLAERIYGDKIDHELRIFIGHICFVYQNDDARQRNGQKIEHISAGTICFYLFCGIVFIFSVAKKYDAFEDDQYKVKDGYCDIPYRTGNDTDDRQQYGIGDIDDKSRRGKSERAETITFQD